MYEYVLDFNLISSSASVFFIFSKTIKNHSNLTRVGLHLQGALYVMEWLENRRFLLPWKNYKLRDYI
jgi:hypothetical protein